MTASTTKPRGRHGDLYPLDKLIVTMHHSAAGTLWRWRSELTTLAALAAAYCWLWSQLTIFWAAVVLAAALGLVLALPWSRRLAVGRFWCVVARHRFHRLCWEARLHTRSGRLPWVLWARPTRVGERLAVWCLAGISAEDFTQHTDELRAACYARDARVTRNPRWSQIVTIDIIRRDTLAASSKVTSPLERLLAIYPEPPGDPVPAVTDGTPTRPHGTPSPISD